MSDTKKVQAEDYFKLGFITSLKNKLIPLCLLCEKTFSNDSMKPSKMKEHLERIHSDKTDKDLEFFKALKAKFNNRPSLETFFQLHVKTDLNAEQKATYNVALNIAKKGNPHTIGEEVIIHALCKVIGNVMKANADTVLKSVSFSASTVKHRIDQMAINVEKILVSELQSSKFSLQLDESTFGSASILIAYVRYFSQSLNCVTDDLLFAKYIGGDTKGETFFRCLKEYLKEHKISHKNIIVVATDGASAMIGRYRGFVTLLKQNAPNVLTIHSFSNLTEFQY